MISSKFYRSVLDSLPQGAVTVNSELVIASANRAVEPLTGLVVADYLGSPLVDLLHVMLPEEIAGNLIDPVRATLDTGARFQVELHPVSSREKSTHLNLTVSPLIEEPDVVTGILLLFEDVSYQKQAARELEENRRRLQALFNHSLDAILIANDEARYVDVNPAACELTGYTREELLDLTVWDLTPATCQEPGVGLWQSFLAAGEQRGEYLLLRKDGTVVPAEYRAVPDILPGLHLSVMHDISARKTAEEALRESEERFQRIARATNEVIFDWDLATDEVWRNEGARQLLGYPPDEVAGNAHWWWEHMHPDDREGALSATKRALVGNSVFYSYEYRLRRADGSYAHVLNRTEIIRDDTGRAIRVIGGTIDISERKQMEAQLRHNEERARVLADVSDALAGTHNGYERALDAVARRVAEHLGDGCFISLVSDDGEWLETIAFHHPQPARLALLRQLLVSPRSARGPLFMPVLESGQPLNIPVTSPEDLRACVAPQNREYLERFGTYSTLTLPLRVQGQIIGLLIVSRDDPGNPYSENDSAFLQNIADRVALAIQNSRLLEGERERAAELARSNRLIAALNKAAASLQLVLDREQILETITAELQQLGYICFFLLLEPDEQVLVLRASSIDPAVLADIEQATGIQPHGLRIAAPQSAMLLELLEQQPGVQSPYPLALLEQLLPDLPVSSLKRAFEMGGLKPGMKMIRLPLIAQEQVTGIVGIWGDELLESDIPALSIFVSQVASALENARLFEEVTEQREQLHLLTGRLAEAEEAERRRLARELHDRVGQSLTALGINLSILRNQMSPGSPPRVRERLEDSARLVQEAMTHARDVMSELRPPALDDFGLTAALRWYAGLFSERTGVRVALYDDLVPPRLPASTESALFRIAQEALTNVAKHADATRVSIDLITEDESALMVIVDNGAGFDQSRLRTSVSWGLMTMRERAEVVGGHVQVESETGKGTRIEVQVPR